MNKLFLIFILFVILNQSIAQSKDETFIKQIFDKELTEGKSYEMLEYLTIKIGARLSGSPGAAAAVDWTRYIMNEYGFDSVYLQPVMVPHWIRGQKESARLLNSKKYGTIELSICALGNTVGTGPSGVMSNVVEVKTFDELKQLGEKGVKGKIVFFNRPFDATMVSTFAAYGGAADQRQLGPSEAAKYGAIGVMVRSMASSSTEEYPHTGSVRYLPNIPKIPAVAVSTKHAELLSKILKEEKDLQLYFETHCRMLDDAPSFNVIGEIKGSEFPGEIIAVGGHLDSWDLAQGAHDDGTGCVQSIEVLRLLKAIGYKPKRTIRAVMFMNEENGLRGGQEYAKQAELNKEKHIAAIESDAGGFTPRGFGLTGTEEAKTKIKNWKPLLEPYGLWDIGKPGGGADISPLAPQGVTLIGFSPDSQRYFDYHHTKEDTFDKVNKRELELGAASMTALVYLIDQYGL
ncbi:MAG: M20/M25/M40 family metallo-hydrolase [Flammeovirgaceae bacterium]|nr:M20/M25/M40 family metallo-hydrolase [Flammeovirgaceae bacterium]